ncbi:flagellar export protein FliJ [Alkaliphilus oremlandii]|uniref:Flagellar FliJ protein n=1 Tax=Alkaliphilus oremlandii (strain OhILAs) TaxID=350688 RepID=A8MHE0_ALKOO|nr:flagellar export protein FliJ [Alkaliphilus oremlandii]ABW19027.1 flagellar export protein FliJ [Alkaliphilus oremlandii OhILAs]
MGKFVFRFNTILNTKEKIEDDRKNKLGLSMKKLAQEKEELKALADKRNNLIEQWQTKSSDIVKISDLRALSNNLELMQNFIDKQNKVVELSEMDAFNKRKELIEASKEKKVFQKLREKDFEEYKYIELKKEYELVDELVSYKASNR